MPIMLLDPADRLLDLPPQQLGPSAPAKPPETQEIPRSGGPHDAS